MEKQREIFMVWSIRTLTIIMAYSLFILLLGSQLAIAGSDDSKIIFSKYIEELEKEQIVVLMSGGRVKNLSNSDGHDWEPSWSFDGRHIAFVSDRNRNGTYPDGPISVYIMNADGSNQYQLTEKTTNHELREFYSSFSPDGRKLIFTRSTNWKFFSDAAQPPAQFKIYTIDIDGRNEKYLTDGFYAKWSPDGKKIVIQEKTNIIIMDANSKNKVKITEGGEPSWSLDGKYIAFSYWNGNLNSSEIYKMDSDGDNIVRLTIGTYQDIEPSWSPDGKYIIFTREINNVGCSIYKVSVNGGTPVLISDNYSEGPSWFDPAFAKYAVNQAGKLPNTWGELKRR